MATVRGMIRADNVNPESVAPLVRAAKEKRPQPKAVDQPKGVVSDEEPLKGATRFITTNGARGLSIKVAMLPEGADDADDDRTLRCIQVLGSDLISFRPIAGALAGAFITHQAPVAAWLRGRIASGRLEGVVEDVSLIDVRCPRCDREFANTTSGQKALAAHIAEDHPE